MPTDSWPHYFFERYMAHKKLIRFEAIKNYPNVLEKPIGMPGKWTHHFGNDAPITLELACGKGEYTIGLAKRNPEGNFIGVDIKGNRIWKGATIALESQLRNVAFLRTDIGHLDQYFREGEVRSIWITFPDPQLRGSRSKKRLTHPRFLRLYASVLQKGGIVHLKTDSPDLYAFTLKVIALFGLTLIAGSDNAYSLAPLYPELLIKTHYEGLDIAKSQKVHYVSFLIDKPLPLELDEQLKETLPNEAMEEKDERDTDPIKRLFE